jgi:hypothetical protein
MGVWTPRHFYGLAVGAPLYEIVAESRKGYPRGGMALMKRLVGTLTLWGLVLVAVAACQTDARQQLMSTSGSQVAMRSIQTRAFDTTNRVKTLTTVIATLQDLEFLIDRADASLGVVTATKIKGMTQLRMSVTIHPRGSDQTLVRASGQFKLEAVDDPEFYQQFFAALERSMFLTAHDVGAPTGVSGSPSGALSKGLIPATATSPVETRLPGSTEVKATLEASKEEVHPFDGIWAGKVVITNQWCVGGTKRFSLTLIVENGQVRGGDPDGIYVADGQVSENGRLQKVSLNNYLLMEGSLTGGILRLHNRDCGANYALKKTEAR